MRLGKHLAYPSLGKHLAYPSLGKHLAYPSNLYTFVPLAVYL